MDPLRPAFCVLNALALMTVASTAQASCGSTFCTLMTDRYAQAVAVGSTSTLYA